MSPSLRRLVLTGSKARLANFESCFGVFSKALEQGGLVLLARQASQIQGSRAEVADARQNETGSLKTGRERAVVRF